MNILFFNSLRAVLDLKQIWVKMDFPCTPWLNAFISSFQFSHSVVSNSLWPHELQHARHPCPSPTPRFHPNPCPLSRYAIQPFHPLSSPSPSALNLSQHQGTFKWVSPSHQVVKVLEFQLQHQSFQWTPRTDLL